MTNLDKKHNVGQYGIILAGFIFRLNDTMKVIEENGIQDKVLQEILANYSAYNSSDYDRKVASVNQLFFCGLSSLILEQPLRQSVTVRFTKIFVQLIDILASAGESTGKKESKTNHHFDYSSEEDFSDDFMIEDDDINRAHNRTVL